MTITSDIQPTGVATMTMKVLHNTCNMCIHNVPLMNALRPVAYLSAPITITCDKLASFGTNIQKLVIFIVILAVFIKFLTINKNSQMTIKNLKQKHLRRNKLTVDYLKTRRSYVKLL